MIKLPENLLDYMCQEFPRFNVNIETFGNLMRIAFYNLENKEGYDIDVVENEVGVTYREIGIEPYFGGSDVAFKSFEEAIAFLKGYRLGLLNK